MNDMVLLRRAYDRQVVYVLCPKCKRVSTQIVSKVRQNDTIETFLRPHCCPVCNSIFYRCRKRKSFIKDWSSDLIIYDSYREQNKEKEYDNYIKERYMGKDKKVSSPSANYVDQNSFLVTSVSDNQSNLNGKLILSHGSYEYNGRRYQINWGKTICITKKILSSSGDEMKSVTIREGTKDGPTFIMGIADADLLVEAVFKLGREHGQAVSTPKREYKQNEQHDHSLRNVNRTETKVSSKDNDKGILYSVPVSLESCDSSGNAIKCTLTLYSDRYVYNNIIKLIDWDMTYGSIYAVRTSLCQKDPDIRYVVIQEHNIKCNTFILKKELAEELVDRITELRTLARQNKSKKHTSEYHDEIHNKQQHNNKNETQRHDELNRKSIKPDDNKKQGRTEINKENKTKKYDTTAHPSSSDVDLNVLLGELNNLIGLHSVKQEIISSVKLLIVNRMRRDKGMPELQVSRHMVFTGNPGTGKTTVARCIAKIYKSLGVVSKGHLVETDRSGLVAGYVGQTALKTAEVIKQAKGGVLFIDEAYSLSSGEGSNDFGREAIDTLVKYMEDYRDDLIVIVAGYSDEMTNFIKMNPGLRSRFNKYIHFSDYTSDEMLEIFKGLCKKNQFILSFPAEKKALKYFESQQGNLTFGNARGVRNYFESVVTRQATRILTLANPSDQEFRTILIDDV